jgi:hypothetical protein
MKNALLLLFLAAVLGGCAVVPYGYGEGRGGYHRDRGYDRGYDRGDGDRRDWGGRQGNYPAGPFQEHGR